MAFKTRSITAVSIDIYLKLIESKAPDCSGQGARRATLVSVLFIAIILIDRVA
jgi:hypothetical protein